MEYYNLGIVGNGANKFTAEQVPIVRMWIRHLANAAPKKPVRIISGRSPLGGVDQWAEEYGDEINCKLIYPAQQNDWAGGYKPRNLAIARTSDEVAVILSGQYPDGYKGMKFKDCYHCNKHPEHPHAWHIKSGGCWTAWQAAALGKRTTWIIV